MSNLRRCAHLSRLSQWSLNILSLLATLVEDAYPFSNKLESKRIPLVLAYEMIVFITYILIFLTLFYFPSQLTYLFQKPCQIT